MATNSRGIQTRALILESMRNQIIETGTTRMSISSITKRVGITRSLFYHYFNNVEEALHALLDHSVDQVLKELTEWDEEHANHAPNLLLDEASQLVIDIVRKDGPFREGLAFGPDTQLYIRFLDQAARAIAQHVNNKMQADLARRPRAQIASLESTVYVLATGLIYLVATHKEIQASEIKQIIVDTLRLDEYYDMTL